MNNNCEYAGGGYCMCGTCQAVRKVMEEVEKVTKEEVDRIFSDAEKALENIEISKFTDSSHTRENG